MLNLRGQSFLLLLLLSFRYNRRRWTFGRLQKQLILFAKLKSSIPKILCCLAINRKIANTTIGRDVRDALAELDVPILKSDIGQHVAFAESTANGSTVMKQIRSKVAKEINKFVDELRRIK